MSTMMRSNSRASNGGDQSSRAPNTRTASKSRSNSVMSMQSSAAQTRNQKKNQKEEAIVKRVVDVFHEREMKMINYIVKTMWDDKLYQYKKYRREFDSKLNELEKDRVKIGRRKKNKKEKNKLLRANTQQRLFIICQVIKQTFIYYKKQYYENDKYRGLQLISMMHEDKEDKNQKKLSKEQTAATNVIAKLTKQKSKSQQAQRRQLEKFDSQIFQDHKQPEKRQAQAVEINKPKFVDIDYRELPDRFQGKKFLDQLQKFFKSPFKEDQRFAVHYMSILTRDDLPVAEEAVNKLFYDTIFSLMLSSKDEMNRHRAFEIMTNMLDSSSHRRTLVKEECFSRLFEKTYPLVDSKDTADLRIVEKLSWLVCQISSHKDMYDLIIKEGMLPFIIKISGAQYPSAIRSNAVLAISLLTYNELLFDEIIKQGVIDLIMELCRDQDSDLIVKQFSSLALVHFALNKKSINILIEKGVLDLFDTFGKGDSGGNVVISTNISWMFLALCTNGITGQQMLVQGITRDMFLVSCNPDYQQIRHLVITGFAELGRVKGPGAAGGTSSLVLDFEPTEDQILIKETAIVGMHDMMEEDAGKNIAILLNFCVMEEIKYQYAAFLQLKDYILLTYGNLIPDISDIIDAFLIGCVTEDPHIQLQCCKGISFLVSHQIVYQSQFKEGMKQKERVKIIENIMKSEPEHILDAIMYLSGNSQKTIGTTAFSILSQLSKLSSQCESVMQQVKRDIEIPNNITSKGHQKFIHERLMKQREKFCTKFSVPENRDQYSGLYSLLRLSQEPKEEQIEEVINKFTDFTEKEYNIEDYKHLENEKYFLKVFIALKKIRDPKILQKLIQVIKFYIDLDQSPIQMQIISPDTILWMLGIINTFYNTPNKYLSCITSHTLLAIVSKHEIVFDYQEVAIIRKFNKALLNIEVFESPHQSEEKPKETTPTPIPAELNQDSYVSEHQSQQKSRNQNFKARRSGILIPNEVQSIPQITVQQNTELSKSLSSKDVESKSIIQEQDQRDEESPEPNEKEGKVIGNAKFIAVSPQTDKVKQHLSERKLIQAKNALHLITDQTVTGSSESKKTKQKRKPLFRQSTASLLAGSGSFDQKDQQIDKKESSVNIAQPIIEEVQESVDVEDIDQNDFDTIDIYLRDSLIKSFMVIFTNAKSQHLLLNKDLIDISINCLEYCNESSPDAKKHLAKLISIIFKFPIVQERILEREIVLGVCDLLSQDAYPDIQRYAIKACTYISQSYDFISSSIYSLDIMKAMLNLLDTLHNKGDQSNIIFTIKNILKGDKENIRYFYDNGGTQKFIEIVLGSDDLQLVEMCISGISQEASFKKVMVQIINNPQLGSQLKIVIEKCLNITEDWHNDVNLKDFEKAKKLALMGEQESSEKKSQHDNEEASLEEESKFQYSLDNSQIEIPEFMKNDLKNLDQNQDGLIDDYQVSKLGKIRNSTYFIVARALKFGFDAEFLISQCNITVKILKDLGLHRENDFMFQNLLLIVGNLKLEIPTIVDMIGNNYETIIDLIFEISNKDHRVSLLKVLIGLILEASEELSYNRLLFQKIFEMAKDIRSDEYMIENVLWLATSLCEQGHFNKNYDVIIENMIQNDILLIIWKCLCSKQERIILQSLKLLQNLADVSEFRTKLFHQPEIFQVIKQISTSTNTFKSYEIEIQTFLCKCLDKITQIGDTGHECNLQLASQTNQIKTFNKYLINLALSKDYFIQRLDEPLITCHSKLTEIKEHTKLTAQISTSEHNSSLKMDQGNIVSRNLQGAIQQKSSTMDQMTRKTIKDLKKQRLEEELKTSKEMDYDDIEKFSDSNEMVEGIICTLSNVSNDHEMHPELIQNGIIDVVSRFIQIYMEKAKLLNDQGVNELTDGIELNVMPVGALNLIKAITLIIKNLCSNSQVHAQCISQGMIDLVKICLNMRDYVVTSQLFETIGYLLRSEQSEIRARACAKGLLQEMLEQHEYSQFYRIRRICSESLNHVAQNDPKLFEMNEKMQIRIKENQIKLGMGRKIQEMNQAPGAM